MMDAWCLASLSSSHFSHMPMPCQFLNCCITYDVRSRVVFCGEWGASKPGIGVFYFWSPLLCYCSTESRVIKKAAGLLSYDTPSSTSSAVLICNSSTNRLYTSKFEFQKHTQQVIKQYSSTTFHVIHYNYTLCTSIPPLALASGIRYSQ